MSRFDLDRFVTAQAPVFATVLEELAAGFKRTHWMWFIFPQLRGLGRSSMATAYGLASLAEAQAYLDHKVLGKRLVLCTRTVLGLEGRSLHAIFGTPDDMKFRSCMTLFALTDAPLPFEQALGKYCDGVRDDRTLELMGRR
jgi:uncharacterized protein (DUF1810 family)